LWLWSFVAIVIPWLLLMPVTILLDHFFGVSNPNLVVPALTFCAFGFLLLTVFAGFAYDIQSKPGPQQAHLMSG